MTPFNGDKIRPRLAVRAGDKTLSWLFDTGAAVTCMTKQSFDLSFGHCKPKQISKPQSCVAASGDKMSSYGVFNVDLFIKGRKFTNPVNVIEELNKNIIGIDLNHAHKLTYDVITHKVMFAGAGTNSIAALKNTVLPSMTSTVIKAKFKGTRDKKANYVANICAPRTPIVSGMPSIVNIDENNICTIVVENFAPYDVTLERDDILGELETEQDELVPLTDDFISSVCQDIHNHFRKVKRKRFSREEISRRCHLQDPEKFHDVIWISCANTRTLLASTSTTWGSPRISSTKYTSGCRIQSTRINSKFRRPTTNSLNKHWTNG